MLNLKSFEDFLYELKPYKRLNENETPNVVIEPQSGLYDKITQKISGKKCLVINNYIMAMDLEKDTTNDVYCIYYDDDPNEAGGVDLSKCKTPREVKEAKLKNPFLPHNFEKNCIAYLGTHDNDVMTNFIQEHPDQKAAMKDYLCIWRDEDILDTMIGALMRSNANVVIFTPQDLLHMDKYSRINTPGVAVGNWQFRIDKKALSKEFSHHLLVMTKEAGR